MTIENANKQPQDYYRQALALEKNPEQAAEIARQAETAGEFEAAIKIKGQILNDREGMKDLMAKAAEKDASLGRFKSAADWIYSSDHYEATRPMAERAMEAGVFEDAIYIYYDLLHDYEKGKEATMKLSEKLAGEKKFSDAAYVITGLKLGREPFDALANAAEANGKYDDAVYIFEEILDDHGDRRRDLRRKWSEQEAAKGNYFDAADIVWKIKDRNAVHALIDAAKESGKLRDAVLILEEILHEYDKHTSALRKQMEEEEEKTDNN